MDCIIFWDRLRTFNTWVAKEIGEKGFLLMDNAPKHKPPDGYVRLDYGNGLHGFMFGNIMTIYLPPNYTSNIQPLDQGIIRAVEQRYRNSLLDWTLNEMEHYDGSIDFGNHVPYSRESLPRLRRSWVDVPTQCL